MTTTATASRVSAATQRAPHPASGPARRRRQPTPAALWVLLLPFLVMFVAFFLAPIAFAIVDSLFTQRSSGLGLGAPTREFVGIDNYSAALTSPSFLASLGRLVAFSAIEVPLMVVTALGLALLLGAGAARFPRLFRVTYFMPYGVPGVIASLLWGFLYIPATSPVLQALGALGVDSVNPLSSDAVLFAIANIALWGFAGYNMLILIAALDAIPSDLYEAARLDGAGEWRLVWHIKLPLIRPSIVLITLFTIIGTLQLFVEPLVLRPLTTAISSDYTPNLAAYNQAFAQGNPNLAAAMAVIVALLAFGFSALFLRIVNRKGNRAW